MSRNGWGSLFASRAILNLPVAVTDDIDLAGAVDDVEVAGVAGRLRDVDGLAEGAVDGLQRDLRGARRGGRRRTGRARCLVAAPAAAAGDRQRRDESDDRATGPYFRSPDRQARSSVPGCR